MTDPDRTSRRLVALAVGLAWYGLCSSRVAAQSSRAELIADEQRAKMERLGPEGPSTVEKGVVWIMRSPLLAGTGGPYPWFGSVYSGTGMGVGAGYLRRMPRGSHLNLLATLSIRGSTVLDARARLPEIAGGLITVDVNAHRTIARNLSFFGIGPDSTEESPLRYDYRPTELGAAVALHPVHWFELSGRYNWMSLRTEERTPGSPGGAPGLGQPLSYHVAQASAALDWRTSPGYSTRGGLQLLTWSRYLEKESRPFSFDELEYEAVQLVPVLREQFVLAVRGLVTLTTTKGADEVPLDLAPTLGGGETLRGFVTRRFTDRNRVLFVGEYRWRPSRFLDMAVFVDAGTVAARRSDLSVSELETDWGLGARFHGPTFTVFRMEGAKSREGWRLILAGHKAF